MAGDARGVTPLKNLGSDGIRNEESVRRNIFWGRMLGLSLMNLGFDLPGKGGHHAASGQDSLRLFWEFIWGKLTGEGVGLDISGAGSIGEGELEPFKKQHPPGLARVQSFSGADVLEVLVVSPDDEWMFGAL